jgi:hypothetical protein
MKSINVSRCGRSLAPYSGVALLVAAGLGIMFCDTLTTHAADEPAKAVADDSSAKPPEGAVVLFDGKDLSKWQKQGGGDPGFNVVDGYAEAHERDIETKDKYRDFKLHVEFDPELSDPNATGEGRGNSGVYLQGRYEIQVMDSFDQKLYPGACAAVYGQKAPDKNMAKPVGQWQSYDIEFHAAKFDGDKKVAPARVTVIWNGETVQDNVDIKGPTGGGAKETGDPGPVRLQYHHNPVRFRNIWIVPIEEK